MYWGAEPPVWLTSAHWGSPFCSADGLFGQNAPEYRVISSVEQLNIIEVGVGAPGDQMGGTGSPEDHPDWWGLLSVPPPCQVPEDPQVATSPQDPQEAPTRLRAQEVIESTCKFQIKNKSFALGSACLRILTRLRLKGREHKQPRQKSGPAKRAAAANKHLDQCLCPFGAAFRKLAPVPRAVYGGQHRPVRGWRRFMGA